MIRADVSSAASSQSLLTAGVGASAGGLEAMLPMFARMRPTGRIAYVVAQHMMHNGHSDLVARVIQRESALPVVLATDGIRLRADAVYLIPSGKDGRVTRETLELSDRSPENISTPSVNALFRSIAETRRAKAIGIVLSGAGSDGTIGCRAIKAHGGITLAQDPAEAKYAGMPSAAITAKLIDRVPSVNQIGETLAGLFPGPAPPPLPKPSPPPTTRPVAADSGPGQPAITEAQHSELVPLLRQILDATGIDFSSYKEETLLRRLEKRKSSLGMSSPDEYQALIRRRPEELRVLQHLFLVSVSSFFRDRESFRALEGALADLILTKAEGRPIRIWVPGCASGEECYTLAIVLFEILCEHRREHPVFITGTDLNPEALEMASFHRFDERETALLDALIPLLAVNLEILPELPGIDTRAGLATAMGNAELYRRLLVKFRDANLNFAEQFAAARGDRDPDAATRCAHTLKGTAGNIGARRIQMAAGDLELSCQAMEPAETIERLLVSTLAELKPVLEILKPLRAGASPATQTQCKVDVAEVRQSITRIKSLLDESDSGAVDEVEKLAGFVRGTPMSPSLEKISAALADFDFSAAMEELQNLEKAV